MPGEGQEARPQSGSSGVALNAKVVEAIQATLGCTVVVPERPWSASALGAPCWNGSSLDSNFIDLLDAEARGAAPLTLELSDYHTSRPDHVR